MLVVAACNDGVEHMYVFQLLIKLYTVVCISWNELKRLFCGDVCDAWVLMSDMFLVTYSLTVTACQVC